MPFLTGIAVYRISTLNKHFSFFQNSVCKSEFIISHHGLIDSIVDVIHVGWLAYKDQYGFISIDGTYSPGVNFVSHNYDSNGILSDNEDLMSLDGCVVYSLTNKKLQYETPCPDTIGLCQKPLGKQFHLETVQFVFFYDNV